MKMGKDSLFFGVFMAMVMPLAWGAPLPFGALDEAKPAKEMEKRNKPKSVPAASGSAKAVSPAAERAPQPAASTAQPVAHWRMPIELARS